MKNIDRRTLLRSLAFGSIYAARTDECNARPRSSEKKGELIWTVVRQPPKLLNGIDFWSMPICTVPYASELGTRITRGVLFSHHEGEDLQSNPSLNYVDRVLDEARNSWLARSCSHRGSVTKAILLSLHNDPFEFAHNGTALVALDISGLCGSGWAEILPALRSHYGRIIGHFHIPDRGFHHWKTRLSQSNEHWFSNFFMRVASQCDAVIFTSQSLLENDVYLPARSSTDMLVAELIRRLSHRLEDSGIAEQMVRCRGEQPLMFALGSAGDPRNSDSLNLGDLARQREIVFQSFGKPLLRPLLIGLDLDRNSEATLQNQILGSNLLLLTARPVEQTERIDEEWLDLITLWPFDPDYGPWP